MSENLSFAALRVPFRSVNTMVNNKRLVALCTSRIYDSQINGFIKNLNEKLVRENCALLVFAINSDIYWDENLNPAEAYVFDLLPYEDLDCIIIMDEKIKSKNVSEKIIRNAAENKVPVIVLDGHYEGTTCINFDYAKGFETIVRHMIEHHHVKNPHMMAGLRNNFFSDQRIEIFKKVLAENNIPCDDSRISYGNFWADPTIEAMHELLKRSNLPDAIICANDIMALNVCGVLKTARISVPRDILVSGFDGYDEIFFSNPKITSVSCDIILLSDAAADAAISILNGKEVQDSYIEPFLMPNESCGCHSHTWHAQSILSSFNNSFYRHQEDMRILYDIASNMETALTPWDMAAAIHNHKTKHHLCVVDSRVFDPEQNYFVIPEEESGKKDLHIINDADYAEEKRFEGRFPLPEDIFYDTTVNDKENVMSGNYRKRMIELLDTGYPLIFNALDYMNKPMGFTCYYFTDYMITDYSRAVNVTNALSMGIGGFANMQYQRYLLDKMDSMYNHDALTGLYNRIGFTIAFDKALPEHKNEPVTVIMSDLDGLKYINDTFGHAEGDRAISTVATALMSAVPKTALSARFGGDELFSVIFGECDSDAIMKRIGKILDDYNACSNMKYKVLTSSGAFKTTLADGFDIKAAIKIADKEMYEVKAFKRQRRLNSDFIQ